MKHQYLLPLVFIPLAFSCSNSNNEKTNEPSVAHDTASVKTAEPLVAPFKINIDAKRFDELAQVQKKKLGFLFGKTHATELLSGVYALNLVKTDADLYACYRFLDSLGALTTEKYMNSEENYPRFSNIDSVQEVYKSVSDLLPYVQLTWEAEGTIPRVMIDHNMMSSLAKNTTGNNDDAYFELYREIFGDSNDDVVTFAVWFDMTWDYGGNSLLGSGNHYKILKHCQEIKNHNVFKPEIEKWENMCLEDALRWNTLYYTAEKAIAELKKIMTLEIGKKNKKQFEERIKNLESPSEDIQLDCEHNHCSYG